MLFFSGLVNDNGLVDYLLFQERVDRGDLGLFSNLLNVDWLFDLGMLEDPNACRKRLCVLIYFDISRLREHLVILLFDVVRICDTVRSHGAFQHRRHRGVLLYELVCVAQDVPGLLVLVDVNTLDGGVNTVFVDYIFIGLPDAAFFRVRQLVLRALLVELHGGQVLGTDVF